MPLKAEEWDGIFWDWDRKPFYRATYWSFLGVPLNLEGVLARAKQDIREHGLEVGGALILTRDEAMFHASILIEVGKGSDKVPVEALSGKYVSRLFRGKTKDNSKYIAQVRRELGKQGLRPQQMLFYHPTCLGCARERGEADTVIFAKVGEYKKAGV